VWQQGRRQYYVTFEMTTQKISGQSVLPVLKAFKITGDVVDERKFPPRSKEPGPYYYYAGSVQRSVRYTWAARGVLPSWAASWRSVSVYMALHWHVCVLVRMYM
jgi:hypothetical protein